MAASEITRDTEWPGVTLLPPSMERDERFDVDGRGVKECAVCDMMDEAVGEAVDVCDRDGVGVPQDDKEKVEELELEGMGETDAGDEEEWEREGDALEEEAREEEGRSGVGDITPEGVRVDMGTLEPDIAPVAEIPVLVMEYVLVTERVGMAPVMVRLGVS